MLKGQSIIGKKILSRMDGQKLDSVKDLVISKDHTRIVAIMTDEGGLFSSPTVIPMEHVVSFGKDAVIVTNSKVVVRADHFPAVKEILDANDNLVKKKVFTETGEELGKVDDVYFDEQSGSIVGLEIEGKIVATAPSASAQLDIGDVVSIGPDAVIIRTTAVDRLAAQVTGAHKASDDGAPKKTMQTPADLQTKPPATDPTPTPSPPTPTVTMPTDVTQRLTSEPEAGQAGDKDVTRASDSEAGDTR
jgi:uncharacterized protein YrrD